MAALFPSEDDARQLATVRAITTWAGLSQDAHDALVAKVGDLSGHIRNLALLPPTIIDQACKAARVPVADNPNRHFTPVEIAQVGISWRLANRLLAADWNTFVDTDPFAPVVIQQAAAAPSAAAQFLVAGHSARTILSDQDRVSRLLACLLRHRGQEHGLEVDSHGFADFAAVESCMQARFGMSADGLRVLVQTSMSRGRPRYEIAGGRIRAMRRHTIPGVML